MLELTVTEELTLPVPIEQAREACERAITQLDWIMREQSPTTLLAREKGLFGIDWLGTKTLTAPADLSVFLSESDNGALVRLNATLMYGKTSAKLFRPFLQGKLNKIRERLLTDVPGARPASAPPPLPGASSTLEPPQAPRVPGRIFISYRRRDSADVTGRIYDRLVNHFGEGAVFQDVEDIPLGMDFSEYIQEVVGKCDAFLAIIGNQWLDAADKAGGRRLDNPADNVRIEIESALLRKIPLIPVLVSGAEMPAADALPESLRKLAMRNATHVRPNPDFRSDMTRLIEGLEELFARKR
jgi:TIR domain-containing protein